MIEGVYVGIDPGIDGAVACIDTEHGCQTINRIPALVVGPGSRRGIDLEGLAQLFGHVKSLAPKVIVIEDVHAMPKQGVSSTFSFGVTYGALQAMIAVYRMPMVKVKPAAWKKIIMRGRPKGKDGTIAYMSQKYPHCSLVPVGGRAKNHNFADALALADYARITVGGGA